MIVVWGRRVPSRVTPRPETAIMPDRYVLTIDPWWQRRRKPGNEIAAPVWTPYLEFVTLWDGLREASLGD